MARQNCWEFKKCGREPGGERAAELGVCPAASAFAIDGLNHGVNGGRVCWSVAGTLCGGQVQGTFGAKLATCAACDFFAHVLCEEGEAACRPQGILKRVEGR
jgi:hypothetical protein